MKANKCPGCKESVMPYKIFIKEAEPGKPAKCHSCGIELNRSKMAVPFLLAMVIIFIALPTFYLGASNMLSDFSGLFLITFSIAYILILAIVINFLAWLFIGWEVIEKPE